MIMKKRSIPKPSLQFFNFFTILGDGAFENQIIVWEYLCNFSEVAITEAVKSSSRFECSHGISS